MPPVPNATLDPSVPVKVRVLLAVRTLELAIVKVPELEEMVKPLTVVGVMAPRIKVMAGVVVAVATVPETPLAVATETEVTVPLLLVVKTPVVDTARPLPTTMPPSDVVVALSKDRLPVVVMPRAGLLARPVPAETLLTPPPPPPLQTLKVAAALLPLDV